MLFFLDTEPERKGSVRFRFPILKYIIAVLKKKSIQQLHMFMLVHTDRQAHTLYR